MFFVRQRKFFLRVRQFLADRVDFIIAGLAFVSSAATTQSIFIGATISILGLALMAWLNGYPTNENGEIRYLAGPYRFVRYPQVLCRCLIVIGLLLASRQAFLYCMAVLVVTPLYRRLSRLEDAITARDLGPAAAEYRAIVSGLIPQLHPAKVGSIFYFEPRRAFSWRRALFARRWVTMSSAIMVLVCLAGHYLWTARLFSDSQWRLGALTLTVSLFAWVLSDRDRPTASAS